MNQNHCNDDDFSLFLIGNLIWYLKAVQIQFSVFIGTGM